MIEATGLKKSFRKKEKGRKIKTIQAVADVSFHAADASITGLLGPNGAGKSTTLRLLATLLKADQGSAVIDGYKTESDSLKVRESIGFLPHNSGIYPRLTARENIHYYARICGLKPAEASKRIDHLVELLEMEDFADRRAQGFSQGQKTKVALGRALIHEPKTLLLDEPTNGLDVMATRGLRKIIRRLRDQGHCILLSSHIMQEIEALCNHVAIISEGTVVMEGSIAEIHQRTGQQDLEDAFVIAIGEQLESE